MYEQATSKYSIISNLESIKARGVILCDSSQVSIINYFCNGLKNEASDTLTFVDFKEYQDNPDSVVSVINQLDQDLIILNYEIDSIVETLKLKEKLKNIDLVLNKVLKNANGSKYTLIVSSLYGMTKTMTSDKGTNVQVVFSNKVPFIYIDDFITRKNYLVEPGTINDIPKSVYKNIRRDSKFDSIVEKKNGLYKLFFK